MSQTNEIYQPQDGRSHEGVADHTPDLRPPEERYAEFVEGYHDSSDFSDENYDGTPTFASNIPWVLVRTISRALRMRSQVSALSDAALLGTNKYRD